MPRQYVNNSYNRRLGRVGMPVGSMSVSSSSGGSGYSCSPRSYVDNSYNRSLGRVGMEVGSMPVSRSSGSTSSGSSSKTYVDNSYNRSIGRVGMEVGSMPVSRSSGSTSSGSSSKTYVDNSYNRSIGRVGMEVGSMPVSSKSTCETTSSLTKVYTDNAMNRRLGRVGKPVGTAVLSTDGKVNKKTYVDNAQNRRLGRVGLPLGSNPVSSGKPKLPIVRKAYEHLRFYPDRETSWLDDYSTVEDEDVEACEVALNILNHENRVKKWKEELKTTEDPKTSRAVLSEYRGTEIVFEEIELKEKIGQGGFGDVHFATWRGSVVAVKKLRVQRVSRRRLDEFTKEVMILCKLDHPNIVKFIGATTKTPNVSIVMEYMQMSLFDALHVKSDEITFSEEEKLNLTRQASAGLKYLHEENIAHCDIKSQNILLDYKKDLMLSAKITDFGLGMMKNEAEMSQSSTDQQRVRNIGTPLYSAPEVLNGEMLKLSDMMKADIYSFSLVVFEIICEEEPFYKLKSYPQLTRQVGENGLTPEIPEDVAMDQSVLKQLEKCWSRNANSRPTSQQLMSFFDETERFYKPSSNATSNEY